MRYSQMNTHEIKRAKSLLKQKVNKFKRDFILTEYKYCHCNQILTAKRLDVHRNSFILYINKLNLRNELTELRRNETRAKGKISHLTVTKNLLRKAVEIYEQNYIENKLTKNHGNVSLSARELGIHINTLFFKIKLFKTRNNFNTPMNQLRESRSNEIDLYIKKIRKPVRRRINNIKITDKQRQEILELINRERLSYRELSKMFNVSYEAIRLIVLQEYNPRQWQNLIDKAQTTEEVLSLPLKVLDLPLKLMIDLPRDNIRTIGDLVNCSNEQLLSVSRIGAVTLSLINNKLEYFAARKGIVLKLKEKNIS